MIKGVRVINPNNETVLMKLDGMEQGPFSLWSIEGLDQGEADIHVTEMATMDGAVYNSSRQNSRELTITALLNWPADSNHTIQWAREQAYKYFPLKKKVKIVIYLDDYDNGGVKAFATEGYVKENVVDIFAKQCAARATIIRTDPFFRPCEDVGTTYGVYKYNTSAFLHYIQYSMTVQVVNNGDDAGIVIEIPIGYDFTVGTIGKNISIVNIDSYNTPDDAGGRYSGEITIWLERLFNYVDFQTRGLKAGDIIRIYNLPNCKDVRIYLYDEMKEVSILGVTDLTKINSAPWPIAHLGTNKYVGTYSYGTPVTSGPLSLITGTDVSKTPLIKYQEGYKGI